MTEKTNALRILEKNKIKFSVHTYRSSGAICGTEVAKEIGKKPERVFKTLVTAGKSGRYFVFVVPVSKELDLKKAAQAVGEKSVSMIKQKELFPTTGYIHGGCSPVGMKKKFETTIDQSATAFETIVFSAGKIGVQVEVSLRELSKALSFKTADIAET